MFHCLLKTFYYKVTKNRFNKISRPLQNKYITTKVIFIVDIGNLVLVKIKVVKVVSKCSQTIVDMIEFFWLKIEFQFFF